MDKTSKGLEVGRWILALLWLAALGGSVYFFRPLGREAAQAREGERLRKIFEQVLPDFDNQPWHEVLRRGRQWFFIARAGDSWTGVAFLVPDSAGFGQTPVMVGMDPQGNLTGHYVFRHPLKGKVEKILQKGKEIFSRHQEELTAVLDTKGDGLLLQGSDPKGGQTPEEEKQLSPFSETNE